MMWTTQTSSQRGSGDPQNPGGRLRTVERDRAVRWPVCTPIRGPCGYRCYPKRCPPHVSDSFACRGAPGRYTLWNNTGVRRRRASGNDLLSGLSDETDRVSVRSWRFGGSHDRCVRPPYEVQVATGFEWYLFRLCRPCEPRAGVFE